MRLKDEAIFDFGLGDIFSVRVAGNVISREVIGSIEYAVAVAGARLVTVVGHTRCGAIAAAVDESCHPGHPVALAFMGNQTSTEFDPGWLDSHTTYFWRIDEVNNNGKRTGLLWKFTVTGPPPKGRGCFTSETDVWINNTLVPISKVSPGHSIGRINSAAIINSSKLLPYLGKVQEVQEHEGIFECHDILLQSGNRISVAERHYFLTESGKWIAVQNLKPTTKLQTPKGPIGIVSVTKRPTPYVGKIYNLKVDGSDRYLVGKDAVIVRDY